MAKNFYTMVNKAGKATKVEKSGTILDNGIAICNDKAVGEWVASDIYSGMKIASGKTKAACEENIKKVADKLTEIRESKKYLESVIAFEELPEK